MIFFKTKRALAPVPFQKKETTRFLQQVLKAKRVQQKVKTTTKYFSCWKQRQGLNVELFSLNSTPADHITQHPRTAASTPASGDHMDGIFLLRVCFEELQRGSAAMSQ
jgi:hypothetical protein